MATTRRRKAEKMGMAFHRVRADPSWVELKIRILLRRALRAELAELEGTERQFPTVTDLLRARRAAGQESPSLRDQCDELGKKVASLPVDMEIRAAMDKLNRRVIREEISLGSAARFSAQLLRLEKSRSGARDEHS